ncbi:MAG: DNA replication and repair protein RecF [Muribaculaceae bacterium]|nr:DNA replication and repair protein RecF [Muribaculaceae bacterium]
MKLQTIEILNFKNIADASLTLSPGLNCFLGLNGMGKSNLLEAIHLLCLARAMSPMPESQLIRHGEQLLSVKGTFMMEGDREEKISAGIVKGKGKSLKHNGKEYERISQHIGRFPLVCVTPADAMLVIGPGDGRRRLMDMVISQADKTYLAHLIRYNKALESRNRMLRAGVRDDLLYESVETGMADAAASIHRARAGWVQKIAPGLENYYHRIAGNDERASMTYRSVLNDASLTDVLNACRSKDIALGYSSQGIHRDDIAMGLGDYSMRRLGSQGQIKTYNIALRLAIFDFLKEAGGITPILLLDDIFDKLDADRVARIIHIVCESDNFSQIFITDTNRTHLDDIIRHIQDDTRLFGVENGQFSLIEHNKATDNAE